MRGLWHGAAALAALAGCARSEDPAPTPERAASAAPAETPALTAPIAAPVADASASPEPTETAVAAPTATPSVKPGPLAAFPPRDECAKLPGFVAFRDKLFAAAKARDADALAALADPKINLDFGGGAGKDELRKRLADPERALWSEIGALAGLGCAADGGIATMPWIFSRLPESYQDASIAMLGAGAELALREKPEADAKVLRTLAWPLVELPGSGFDPKARFTEVRLADGSRGYLETARLRSLLDYRLIADRQGETWRVTALIAGD
ncbi:MAG: hypothetical protein LC648_09000 [Novosphingobium sp.]|nr:hypothetical protein [Novosphingobium sp.]